MAPYEGPKPGTKPGSLLDLVKHWENQIDPAARVMAEDTGKRIVQLTKDNTPVSENPGLFIQLFGRNTSPAHEHLRNKISKRQTVVLTDTFGNVVYETGAETDVEYAPYVEEGTGLWGPSHAPYEIKPKSPSGTLHWVNPKTGQSIFAKRVLHPGSPGNHMFAIGVFATEQEFNQVAARGMDEFKRRCEAYRNGPL